MPNDEGFHYRDGLVVLCTVRDAPEWMTYDERVEAYVAPGHRMPELRAWAAARNVPETGPGPDALETPLFDPRRPRDYQAEALARWRAAGRRGTVVLPTGSGKTFLAILAIDAVRGGACVCAPTKALVVQWFGQLADAFGAERVGTFYGDEKDPRSITVTTYHSAFRLLERWGGRFGLVVLDEAHHLEDAASGGAKGWHDALVVAPAASRLGLTATYPDGRDATLRRLVGPVVYRRTIGEMADAELADFALERRFVRFTEAEREAYERATEEYDSFVETKGYRRRYPDPEDAWKVFMAETRRSPRARRAFRAFLERERLVALPARKMDEAIRLLGLYPAERSIVFCGRTGVAERVSRRLAIPMISADTPARERKEILDRIESGEVRSVASVRVLDEGWDVPSAKLGIVLGDSTRGSRRQHVQRLGRLLRRQGEAVASLYEIVVADTHEFLASQKRRGGLRTADAGQYSLGI